MASIYLLIPIALLFTALAVWLLVWAVNNNQYDDLDKAATSILFETDEKTAAAGQDVSVIDTNRQGERCE